MTQHTPGPWTFTGEHFKHDASAIIMGKDGKFVAAALDFNRYDREDEVEANARLIAAGPDLLDACQALVKAFDYYGNGGVDADTVEMVEKAITKATGYFA